MIALTLVLLYAILGILVIHIFGLKTFPSWPEKIASGIALGIAAPATLGALLNILFPTSISVWIAWIVWASFSIIAFIFLKNKSSASETKTGQSNYLRLSDWFLICSLTTVISVLSFTQLMPQGSQSSIPNRGSNDTIFHLTQIEYIAKSTNWHFSSPYFADEFINYPFLSEFFSANLVKFGSNIIPAYHWPDVVLFFSLLIFLVLLAKIFSKKFSLGLIFVLSALFASGISYLNINYLSLSPSRVSFPLEPISFQGLVLSFLLFQKSFILGAPLGLACIYAIIKYIRTQEKNNLLWALIFGTLLPFSHTHTFVAVSIGFVGLLIGLIISKSPHVKDFFKFLFIFASLTLPQILAIILLPKFSLGTAPFFRLGWMSSSLEAGGIKLAGPNGGSLIPWLLLQMWNFGFLLVWPILGWQTFQKKQSKPIAFVLFSAGALIWILANLVQFQAWDYDNNKLFVYAIIFFLLSAIAYISDLVETSQKKAIAIFGIIILLSLPMSVIRIYQTFHFSLTDRKTIFTQNETSAAVWLDKNTDENSVLLTGLNKTTQDSNYLVGILAGRTNSEAFVLWLYTHDIDYQPRQKDILTFLQNPKDQQALKKIPADYFIVGPESLNDIPNLLKNLSAAGFKLVYENSTFRIYSLR